MLHAAKIAIIGNIAYMNYKTSFKVARCFEEGNFVSHNNYIDDSYVLRFCRK